MGAVPDKPYDYVDFGEAGVPDDVLKQQLISLMCERKLLGPAITVMVWIIMWRESYWRFRLRGP